MEERYTRVYDLDVTYPPGAHTPGWRPWGWNPATPFVWPTYGRSLALATARRRAAELESYGAYVTICPSNPITWPSTPAEAEHAVTLADQVAILRMALERERQQVARWRTLYEGEKARADRLTKPEIPKEPETYGQHREAGHGSAPAHA